MLETAQIGHLIYQYRRVLNLSQPELAAAIGTSTDTIRRWEKHIHQIKEEHFKQLATTLGRDFLIEVETVLNKKFSFDVEPKKIEIKTVSHLIRYHMIKKNLNIEDCAKKLFVSKQAFHLWLAKNHVPYLQEKPLFDLFGQEFKLAFERIVFSKPPSFEYQDTHLKIAELLKMHRQRNGITQISLGKKLDCGHSQVCKWEKGSPIPEKHHPRLFEIFGTSFRKQFIQLLDRLEPLAQAS